MTVVVLYIDARSTPPYFFRRQLDWNLNLQAQEAVEMVLGQEKADQVQRDLIKGNHQLTISWTNRNTEEHSDVGGVGRLDWPIADGSILAILYMSDSSSPDVMEQISEWMAESYTL